MDKSKTEDFDLKKMIADYMEGGMLDNIVDMYKHDQDLYAFIGDFMKDERMRVRIGVTALLEILKKEDPGHIAQAVPSILPLLKDQNPVIRGDAANLFGIIGEKETLPFLEDMLRDEDQNVRTIVQESIDEIKSAS